MKLRVKLNQLNREPECVPTLELFAETIGQCELHIFESTGSKGGKWKHIMSYRPHIVKRGPCFLRISRVGLTYSILKEFDLASTFKHCPRCKDLIVAKHGREVERHKAFCSKFTMAEIRRGSGKLHLTFSNLKFNHRRTILEKLLELSVTVGDEFRTNLNLCTFDTESYLVNLEPRVKKLALYSENLSFGNSQKTA
ncbi:MAG: hypothetical protein GY816_20660, partial [Cytophagales bacterium]|nr:hypothetical protein [Cytophagales bacterium]